ncbi:hypothetical protein SAMN02927900_04775 [Rhizobium mongolense subsp. loessense]|uniref:Uncharacterized protein n=1 Tax=Rhizobium mongolense subsp. loessense TaxID=158890 RepID=A0A1G4T9C6_9HYPH|nr:hypothetical protein [Rhizobium mongolense]SCW77149.1 hypothetical protein SAMN02927900_04775 [Rhizobium mongolense subsp. loessense]
MRWETVNDTTSRLKVPGGWIYKIKSHSYSDPEIACVFVPEVKTDD